MVPSGPLKSSKSFDLELFLSFTIRPYGCGNRTPQEVSISWGVCFLEDLLRFISNLSNQTLKFRGILDPVKNIVFTPLTNP